MAISERYYDSGPIQLSCRLCKNNSSILNGNCGFIISFIVVRTYHHTHSQKQQILSLRNHLNDRIKCLHSEASLLKENRLEDGAGLLSPLTSGELRNKPQPRPGSVHHSCLRHHPPNRRLPLERLRLRSLQTNCLEVRTPRYRVHCHQDCHLYRALNCRVLQAPSTIQEPQ